MFEPVEKGIKGADIKQFINKNIGNSNGVILWETKNTKNFNKNWIDKLRKDMQELNADICVLVSVTLPDEIENFGLIDDIWVTDFRTAISLCASLRHTVEKVFKEKVKNINQHDLKDVLYQYITGDNFFQRVKSIATAFKNMQDDLDTEKRSLNRIWKKRETQINNVLENMTSLYGELEGCLGKSTAIPDFEIASLDVIADE